jgi:hypothetical protein
MIEKHAADLASRMGIKLSEISFLEDKDVDMHLLLLNATTKHVSVPVRQQDIDDLLNGTDSTRLDLKLCSALSRLKDTSGGVK